ncbi:MAG: ADP-ribosylglycohydrolase family protein, partial [Streptomyces sp.]|nr:ADP-ribosylglycohydrolase family protein [Streptomyces sp.]
MTATTVRKRAATGTLIGLALGDALGFPTEFNDVPSILAKCGPWREMQLPERALVSDDTQMTLALGRGLRTAMDRGLLGPLRLERPLREEFVDWYQSPENNRAPGRTCLTACNLLKDERRLWQDASQIGSKGCGANMRVAPIGLAPGLSDEQRSGAAQLQSALTHGHPTALAASDLTAHAVRLLAQGAEPTGLIGLLRSYAIENRTRYHERWLGDLWTRSQDPSAEHFIARGWD